MNNIKDILEERNNTHGSFTVNAIISQELKRVIKVYIVYNSHLTPQMQEALDVICGKIARIIAGDPFHVDHWRDIAGYATLIQNMLKEKENDGLTGD